MNYAYAMRRVLRDNSLRNNYAHITRITLLLRVLRAITHLRKIFYANYLRNAKMSRRKHFLNYAYASRNTPRRVLRTRSRNPWIYPSD